MPQGRLEEALAEMSRALELDPLSLPGSAVLGYLYYYMHQYDQAIDQLLQTLVLDPDYPVAHLYLARAYTMKGMYEEAIAACHKGLRAGDSARSHLAVAYAKMGREAEARQILQESLTLSEQRYVSPSWIARMYFALGDEARGFEWLEKAYQERDMWVAHMNVDPFYATFRSDPRFTAMLKKMNLEP
jgi:tetratricopeptide (TPR) repeat protein